MLDEATAIADLELLGALRSDLREEEAELAAELDPGTEGRDGLGVDVGHVDRVPDLTLQEGGADRLGDLDADELLGLCR